MCGRPPRPLPFLRDVKETDCGCPRGRDALGLASADTARSKAANEAHNMSVGRSRRRRARYETVCRLLWFISCCERLIKAQSVSAGLQGVSASDKGINPGPADPGSMRGCDARGRSRDVLLSGCIRCSYAIMRWYKLRTRVPVNCVNVEDSSSRESAWGVQRY